VARPRTTSDEAILRAAGGVLGRLGPGRLTLAAVAAEAGLAPATLVQRFGSKRGLLLALARQATPAVRDRFARAREGSPGPLQALHTALGGMAATVRTPQDLASSIAFLRLDLTDPDFHLLAAEHARAVREEITALLREAADAGDLRPGTGTGALARSVQIAYNGVLIVWALTGEGGDLLDVLRADLDHLLAPYRPGGHPPQV
jgi:AcrR family transcriptional regulator